MNASQTAVELAGNRFRNGVIDFLDVLEAQGTLYAAQAELARSEQTVSSDLVSLYKALGGGWETVERQSGQARGRRGESGLTARLVCSLKSE